MHIRKYMMWYNEKGSLRSNVEITDVKQKFH